METNGNGNSSSSIASISPHTHTRPDPVELNDYGKPITPPTRHPALSAGAARSESGNIPASPNAQSLLKQTSTEIKRQRRGEMVEFGEVMGLILGIENCHGGGEIYKQIGLSPRTFNEDKQKSQARKTTKYAILGLIAEQNEIKNHQLTKHELSIIFSALTHHIQTRAEQYQDEVKQLQKTIMNMIVEQ